MTDKYAMVVYDWLTPNASLPPMRGNWLFIPAYRSIFAKTTHSQQTFIFILNMGIKELRTALKVDLNRPAKDQPGLHVWLRTLYTWQRVDQLTFFLEPLASR